MNTPFTVMKRFQGTFRDVPRVIVTAMDDKRVQGFEKWEGVGQSNFDVKHNGKKFKLGSGSVQHTYYFPLAK